jgi:hypothetical protein
MFMSYAKTEVSRIAVVLATVAMMAAGSAAMAQQSTTQFAAGVNNPQGALVLGGTAINPATGNVFRHLWTADPVNGLCRLDPDVDTVASHAMNPATCLSAVNGAAFNPGQMTFDPGSNTIYAVDGGNKLGVFVLHFQPGGDSGQGSMDPVNQSLLAPNCGIASNQPNATSLGPDGNLYVGFRRSGSIMRIISPLTNPLPCVNVQPTVIATGDRLTSQMAWVGHTMFLNDSRITLIIDGADNCLTPQNGNIVCVSLRSFPALLVAQSTVVSDQTPGRTDGAGVYFGGSLIGTVSAETGLTQNPFSGSLNGGTFTSPFGGGDIFFANIGALALDAFDPANQVVYVGDDPSAGATNGTGRWFQILSTPPAPAPPSAPLNVAATAGNASALLTWTAPGNHEPVTSYTVHISFASNGLAVADLTVTAAIGSTVVPRSTNITGLVNGVTYQFEVLATNNLGSGPFSLPSNSVTPQTPTVPGAPTNVSASAGNASATVSWVAPASDGGSPITSYTVSSFTGGVPSGVPAPVVGGGQNSALVAGLTNGVPYTFSVHATSSAGDGPESTQSAAVTPVAVTAPDLAFTMTGPASVVAGANAVYSMVVTNLGPSTASAVTVTDQATGATVSSTTTSQGSCTIVSTNINCNLGSVAAGGSVTITVTLKPATQTTNQASVSSSAVDPNPANNGASVTTTVIPLNQTTDVQLVGSAQNGGPAVTAPDTFTWQIKNAQSLAANGVHFASTLAPGMVLQSVSGTLGATCSFPASGTAGATFTCDLATLSGGQTMVVTVGVTFHATGTMSTTGQATFNGTDNNTANNSAAITVGVK